MNNPIVCACLLLVHIFSVCTDTSGKLSSVLYWVVSSSSCCNWPTTIGVCVDGQVPPPRGGRGGVEAFQGRMETHPTTSPLETVPGEGHCSPLDLIFFWKKCGILIKKLSFPTTIEKIQISTPSWKFSEGIDFENHPPPPPLAENHVVYLWFGVQYISFPVLLLGDRARYLQ
jgi:hypothetical protein